MAVPLSVHSNLATTLRLPVPDHDIPIQKGDHTATTTPHGAQQSTSPLLVSHLICWWPFAKDHLLSLVIETWKAG